MKLKFKRRVRLLAKLISVILVFYLSFGILDGQNRVYKKKKELQEVSLNLEEKKSNNEKLRELLKLAQNKDPDYIEHIARQVLGYVKQDEKVFINIAGN